MIVHDNTLLGLFSLCVDVVVAADRLLTHIPKVWCCLNNIPIRTKWPGIRKMFPLSMRVCIYKQRKENIETDMCDRDISTQNMLMISFFTPVK